MRSLIVTMCAALLLSGCALGGGGDVVNNADGAEKAYVRNILLRLERYMLSATENAPEAFTAEDRRRIQLFISALPALQKDPHSVQFLVDDHVAFPMMTGLAMGDDVIAVNLMYITTTTGISERNTIKALVHAIATRYYENDKWLEQLTDKVALHSVIDPEA